MVGTDPDGDRVRYTIYLWSDTDNARSFETGWLDSGATVTFTVPNDFALPEGQWWWRAKAVDILGAESAWSPQRGFTVKAPKPDLIPGNLTVSPTGVMVGQKVTVSFLVKNQGTGVSAECTTEVRLGLSPARPAPADPLLISLVTPSLPPGGSTNSQVEVTIPSNTPPGRYFIWVSVDTDRRAGGCYK